MLVISRRTGESFLIGDDIEIFILEAGNDRIKIGIEAPKNVRIIRKELKETEKINTEAAISDRDIDLDALNQALSQKK